jgi:serine/threonine-protein kinase
VLNASPARHVGTTLGGRYRLDALIGEGASAWVFGGQDLLLEREVAIKLLKPYALSEQGSRSRRFVAEGRTLAKLVHPHVVLVYDAGETPDGAAYLVMELSGAGALEVELARRGALGVEETLNLLMPLLGALACAHDRGIIHRDIKPANIAVVHDRRGAARAKLLDFGIAKRGDPSESSEGAVGTPSYMAPEQARGEPLTAAADVWAMGVVFFRCLSGRLPFESGTTTGTLNALVHERAPWFSDACPELPRHIALALDRALEPNQRRRYPDMLGFAQALAVACAQEGVPLRKQPDPLGLPHFEDWLKPDRAAATESWQPGSAKRVASGLTSPMLRGRAWLFAVPLTLAAVAAALAFSGRKVGSARAEQATSAAAIQSFPPAAPAEPVLKREIAPAVVPSAPLPVSVRVHAPRRRPTPPVAKPPTSEDLRLESPASGQPPPKPALITTWSLE